MSEEERTRHSGEVGGVWFFDGEGVTNLAESSVGSATVLVPTEQILIVLSDLPLPTRRQRLSALPFAIEDQIADPIGDVHTALGEEVSPRRHIAGAVRHSIMAEWVSKATEAGLTHCAIVPDALCLPVPDEGSWATQVSGERVLVRTSDGTGFATSLPQFPGLWAAAGHPICIEHGEALPPEITSVPGVLELEPLTARLMVPVLDLRQGIYAKPRRPVPLSARKVLAVLGVGVLIHAVIAILDTFALQSIANDRRAEAQALAQQYLPGAGAVDGNLAAEVNELLARGGGPPRSRFFPLLVRSSGALGQTGGSTALRSLGYDDRTRELSLQIEQADLVSLQRTQGALATAGLNPVSGTTTVQSNVAGANIVVREVARGTGQ